MTSRDADVQRIFFRKTQEIKRKGIITTGLHVMDATTTDRMDIRASPITNVLVAVPLINWSIPPGQPILQRDANRMIEALSAVRIDPSSGVNGIGHPLSHAASPSVRYLAKGRSLILKSSEYPDLRLIDVPLYIHHRLHYFIERAQTLGMVINFGDSHAISTVLSTTNQRGKIQIARKIGSLSSTSATGSINYASDWEFAPPLPSSFLAGRPEVPHIEQPRIKEFYSRSVHGRDSRLPERIAAHPQCVCCDKQANSIEHCIPNWLTQRVNATSVTARLLCSDCNAFFSKSLETPIADAFDKNNLRLFDAYGKPIWRRWAIKTAIFTSLAVNSRVTGRYLKQLRTGSAPRELIVKIAKRGPQEPGYRFWTQYPNQRQLTTGFLNFGFTSGQLSFSVHSEGVWPIFPVSRLIESQDSTI